MFVIDRFEGEYAVAFNTENDDRERRIPRVLLPAGAQPGDCFDRLDGEYRLNREESEKRRAQRDAELNNLYN